MSQTYTVMTKGRAPASSYWVNSTREELSRWITERRHQMDTPTVGDAAYAPSLVKAKAKDEEY
jgi:hypothetical protein